mgnify:FL=1|tara:strand:- start:320 stop:499 length:180 start_codon:yes stop_codon:yes gene_type:complete
MKRYGEINEVIFRNHGYCPYNQATKYKLSYYGEVYFVYVDNYKQLKAEISKLNNSTVGS